jgi:hypothetical protein
MKKAIQFIVSILATFTLAAGVASAQTNCTISNTGANSDNSCTANETSKCTVTNKNDVNVDNNNHQTSTSGGATSSDNRGGGSATSGNASNSNDTNTVVDIVNSNACVKAPISPSNNQSNNQNQSSQNVPSKVKAVSKKRPVRAEAQSAEVLSANVETLPETSASTPVPTVGLIVSVLGAGAVLARFGAAAAKRFTN